MLPKRKQTEAEVFAYISENRIVKLNELYRHIIRCFNMTDEEIAKKDGQGTSWIEHEVRWALENLKKRDLIVHGTGKGIWMIA